MPLIISRYRDHMRKRYTCYNYLQSGMMVSTKYLPVKSMSWTLISARILKEVQLMIVLGVPPLTSSYNLGDNLLACEEIYVSTVEKQSDVILVVIEQ
jgi:hypothetical protein